MLYSLILKNAYVFAMVAWVSTALLLAWLSLGVGIIGADGDPANAMYFGVIGIGIIGAAVARLRPNGMARSMCAMAVAQILVGGIALIGGLGRPWSGPAEIILLNAFFVALLLGSAWLFSCAARRR